MDNSYDSVGAKAALSRYSIPDCNSTSEDLSLFKCEGYKVCPFGSPVVYKLVKVSEDTSDIEEATFTVHGIILEKDLPPIRPESHFMLDEKSKRRYAAYIRQYVAITGLNLEEFNTTLQGLMKVHQYFHDVLPNNKLEHMELLSIDGHPALACHTRYFNARRHYRSSIPHPFGPGVDPNGDLERIGGDLYIHTDENVVQYLENKTDAEKPTKYVNINPVRFQKGDIVKITISFFCVRTRSDTLKMLTSLNTLTLIDDTFRQKARENDVKILLAQNLTKVQVKRRFVDTEDDGIISNKHARMDVT